MPGPEYPKKKAHALHKKDPPSAMSKGKVGLNRLRDLWIALISASDFRVHMGYAPNENKISYRRSAARRLPAGLRVWMRISRRK